MKQSGDNILFSAASLAAVAILGTALLTGVHKLTKERIEQQERRVVLQQLEQIITPDRYDNEIQDDLFELDDEFYFPRGQNVVAYRARKDGEPVAVILKFAAVNGYNGKINLLVGINQDGSLSGVRVVSHKETPGLGDAIEAERSDWVFEFSGRSLQDPAADGWSVKRDGGTFDQFTGATITPRAVVKGVRLALEYFSANQTFLFESQSKISAVEES